MLYPQTDLFRSDKGCEEADDFEAPADGEQDNVDNVT